MSVNVRDDRVLPLTRGLAIGVIPVLAAAFVILYLFPDRTRQLWAWTIDPTMSAMFMGGGYLAGVYLFFRAARTPRWHEISVGIVAIWVYACLLLIATIIHWDRFNHDHVSFWAWLALYMSTPALLPLLWLRNRRFDPRDPQPGERLVPRAVRIAMVAVGVAQLPIVVVAVVRPESIIEGSPWRLTPLTARTLAAFAAFATVTYLAFAFDRRWSSFRIVIETIVLALAVIGLAAVRAADEFDGGEVVVWGWRVGLVVAFVLLLTLRLAMGGRRA